MAAMDFSLRRDDRGMSVFWMILIMGAGVFGILALVLVGSGADNTDEAVAEILDDNGPAVMVDDGETTVTGTANSQAQSVENDETFLDDDETVGGPLPEGDLSVEDVEVEVTPGDSPSIVDPEEAAGSLVEGNVDEGVEGAGGGVSANQEDVIVDPDGTTAPVVPTPSGPEGDDDDALTVD